MLALGMRVHAVARRLCIDERTIYRWKRLPVFHQALVRECLAPLNVEAMRKLRQPKTPQKTDYRFEGKTFATAEEYLAEIERLYPAMESYNRLPKWAR